MFTRIIACLSILSLVALAGCNTLGRQPKLRDAAIEPGVLRPGGVGLITVDAKDRFDVISRVEGVVVQDPRMRLPLSDDGVAPDAKAGDGVWSLEVEVPDEAVPGEFTLDITAFDRDGNPVLVKNEEGNVVVLTATCDVIIQPAEPAPPLE
jgi:hypothetical protein